MKICSFINNIDHEAKSNKYHLKNAKIKLPHGLETSKKRELRTLGFGTLKLNPNCFAFSDAVAAGTVFLGSFCNWPSFSSSAGTSMFPAVPNRNEGKEMLRDFSLDSGIFPAIPNASIMGKEVSGRRTKRDDEGPSQSTFTGTVLPDARRITGEVYTNFSFPSWSEKDTTPFSLLRSTFTDPLRG